MIKLLLLIRLLGEGLTSTRKTAALATNGHYIARAGLGFLKVQNASDLEPFEVSCFGSAKKMRADEPVILVVLNDTPAIERDSSTGGF